LCGVALWKNGNDDHLLWSIAATFWRAAAMPAPNSIHAFPDHGAAAASLLQFRAN
jgi:hypothetical protein